MRMATRERLIPAVLFAALALLYACCAPRGIALEDDGLFAMAAAFGGMAHPPGYPLWTLVAHGLAQVPLGSVAWRVHVLSGIFGALAVVLLWHFARALRLSLAGATLAAAAYGVSRVFWSQSIIAEVYTLNAAIVFGLALLAQRWSASEPGPDRGRAAAFGLVFGLGLANHWPLLILEAPALALLLWPARARVARKAPVLVATLLAGLLPYAWLVLRSHQDLPVSYYGPIETWQDFWHLVTRADYASADVSGTAGWDDRARFLGFVLTELAVQFGPFGAALVATGAYLRARARRIEDAALLAGFLGPTVVLVLLLGFDFDPLHRSIFRVYPAAAYGFAALWLGFGAEAMLRRLSPYVTPRVVVLTAAALAVAVPLVLGAPENVRARDDWASRYGAALLAVPQRDAVLFADGDSVAGPAGYLHLVEGARPDLTLYSGWGVVFGNRLFRSDRGEDGAQALGNFIAASQKPMYYVTPLAHAFAAEHLGVMQRIEKSRRAGLEQVGHSDATFRFYEWLLAQPVPADPWARFHRSLLFGQMSRYLLRLPASRLTPQQQAWREQALARARETLHGNLAQADLLLALHGKGAVPEALAMMDRAEQQLGDAVHKRDYAEPARIRRAALQLR
jgi:hypothetical protein